MERIGSDSWDAANGRKLWIGIGISLSLHALLLTLNFTFPEASRAFQDKALEIILVNSRSAHKPTDAQALAQTMHLPLRNRPRHRRHVRQLRSI